MFLVHNIDKSEFEIDDVVLELLIETKWTTLVDVCNSIVLSMQSNMSYLLSKESLSFTLSFYAGG